MGTSSLAACNNARSHYLSDDDRTHPSIRLNEIIDSSKSIDLRNLSGLSLLQERGITEAPPQTYVAVHIQIDGNRVMIMHPMKHCKMMDATIMEEDPFVELRKRAHVPLTNQEQMEARGMEPDHMHATVFPLDTLFCKFVFTAWEFVWNFCKGTLEQLQ